ncbi:MAG: CPBP family intramembrane metalloprotease [Clostridiales bacterium]|nr:CPBP family intramembrane metalloprotease [Clostridiales bacterium]
MRRLSYDKKDLGYSFALTTLVMVVAALVLQFFIGAAASGWKFWLMQALYTLLIGSSAFLYAAISKTNVFVATRLDRHPILSHVLWGCGAAVFLVLCMSQINNLFLDLIESLGLKRPSVELDNNFAGLIICACILPAFAEEIVFRGTLAQSLYNHKSKVAALAISGALFSLFHANPAQTLHQFVLGVFLTLLVFRSGSLWTSIIVHFFSNAFVVLLAYTPLGDDEFWNLQTNVFALPLMIIGIAGFVVCVLFYVLTTKSNWQKPVVDTVDTPAESDGDAEVTSDEEPIEAESATANRKLSNTPLWVGIFVCAVLWIAQLLE